MKMRDLILEQISAKHVLCEFNMYWGRPAPAPSHANRAVWAVLTTGFDAFTEITGAMHEIIKAAPTAAAGFDAARTLADRLLVGNLR